jgi:hypothetical protein
MDRSPYNVNTFRLGFPNPIFKINLWVLKYFYIKLTSILLVSTPAGSEGVGYTRGAGAEVPVSSSCVNYTHEVEAEVAVISSVLGEE